MLLAYIVTLALALPEERHRLAIDEPVSVSSTTELGIHVRGDPNLPLLLLVPGLVGLPTIGLYDPLMNPLSEHSLTVQYDMRGMAMSKDNNPLRGNWDTHGRDLVALKAYLLQRFNKTHLTMMSYSFGAWVMAKSCEYDCSAVDKFVFVAPVLDPTENANAYVEWLRTRIPSPYNWFVLNPLEMPLSLVIPVLFIDLLYLELLGQSSLDCKNYIDSKKGIVCMETFANLMKTAYKPYADTYMEVNLDVFLNAQRVEIDCPYGNCIQNYYFAMNGTEIHVVQGQFDNITSSKVQRNAFDKIPNANKHFHTVPYAHGMMARYDFLGFLLQVLRA